MTERITGLMTVAEFLTWDGEVDTNYELVDGVPRALPRPTGWHGTIVANLAGIVYAALKSRHPCRGEAQAGIRMGERTWWQADIAVTCREPDQETREPHLIIEVLLPSTRMNDLGRKLGDYKTLPSVQEIWMIDSERRWSQIWKRQDETWGAIDLVGTARFRSDVLGNTVALDDIYENSDR